MLSWLPIVGPIIDGLVSAWNKFQDKDIVRIQTEGTTTVAETKAAVEIIKATEDDIGVRLARDVLIWPPVIWMALLCWDKIINIKFPWLVWGVLPFPSQLSYLPIMVAIFLLGNTGFNTWRRSRG